MRVLLVEEPEAHLHPQLQDLLMRFLETEAGGETQVVVTTHSPSFASAAQVERLTVLASNSEPPSPAARLPRDFGLQPKQLAYLHRFLDVTKASLFFARAVILVEGVAEQLLIPVFAERLRRPLAANGVAVINIGGVAFPPFTDLFGPNKLPYRLSVISDSDAQPAEEEVEGEVEALSPRAALLQARAGDNVHVALADRTLEWDLAKAGNTDILLEALSNVMPVAGPKLAKQLEGRSATEHADAILSRLEKSKIKGTFAQELAELIANPERKFEVPAYLKQAIEWVTEAPGDADGGGAQ